MKWGDLEDAPLLQHFLPLQIMGWGRELPWFEATPLFPVCMIFLKAYRHHPPGDAGSIRNINDYRQALSGDHLNYKENRKQVRIKTENWLDINTNISNFTFQRTWSQGILGFKVIRGVASEHLLTQGLPTWAVYLPAFPPPRRNPT